MDLRANTAVDVLIGPFLDSTDGNTTEDGLTIAQADVKLSKNGQALAQKNDNTTCAFDDDGYYNCELDATDLNTEGTIVLISHMAGALPIRHEYNVLSEASWDSLYAPKDTGFMDVNIKAISEDETAPNNLELDYDGTGYDKANSTIGTCTVNTDFRHTIDVEYNIPNSIDLADTSVIIGMSLITSRGALPTTGEITVGTIQILRKAKGSTSWTTIQGATPMFEEAGLIYFPEVFNTGAGYVEGDSVLIIFEGQAVVIDGVTYELVNTATGKYAQTEIRETTVPTLNQIASDVVGLGGDSIPTAEVIVDEWETQSQADPTGFHVNLLELNGVSQSLLDLVDLVDNGYDPATNSIEQCKVNDDMYSSVMRGTDGVPTDKTGYRLSATGVDDILDEVVEGTLTLRQITRIMLSILANITTNNGLRFRDVANGKNRAVIITDVNGNRTSSVLDGT